MDDTGISRLLRLIVLALPVAASLPLVAGFFAAWHPAFDSLAHFRAHLAVATAVLALPALLAGYWKEAGLAIVLGTAAFATTARGLPLPILGPVNAAFEPKAEEKAVYRLLHLNLRFDNPTPEQVLSLIGRSQPDFVALNEVSESWAQQLAHISAAYPFSIVCPATDVVGPAAILSRRPFAAGGSGTCLEAGALATAAFDLGGQSVTIAALHLEWPWPAGQSQQIDRLMSPLSALGDTALLAGDLNATPWSHAVARIGEAGGLTLVSGSTPTWLYRKLPKSWRQWMGLPLDNIFRKGAVTVHSVRILDDVGSDHAPVLVEFSLDGEPHREPESATVFNRFGQNGPILNAS